MLSVIMDSCIKLSEGVDLEAVRFTFLFRKRLVALKLSANKVRGLEEVGGAAGS